MPNYFDTKFGIKNKYKIFLNGCLKSYITQGRRSDQTGQMILFYKIKMNEGSICRAKLNLK